MKRRAPTFTAFAVALGVTFTPAQDVLFRVLFDGVEPNAIEGDAGDLARRMFGDVETVPPIARETAAIVKGARIGGSRFGALRLLHLALTVDLSTLAPGEIASGLIVGPDMRLAKQAYRYALGAVRAAPNLRAMLDGKPTKTSFTLRRRDGRSVTIEVLPATRGGSAVRARSLVGVHFTEFAFFRDAEFVVNDAELYRAVAPRIVRGGQIIIESTPWAESGLLYDLFSTNHGKPTTALAAHCPTLLMRDDERTAAIVAAERERDPENAEREFDALFLTAGSGLFFDAHAIDACVDPLLTLPALSDGWRGRAHAGGDAAFTSDSSAIAIVGSKANAMTVLALDEVKPEKGKPLKPSLVVKGWASTAKAFACPFVAVDSHYRETVREHLEAERLELRNAPEGQRGKAFTYLELRKAIYERRIVLPKHERLIAQLKRVVSKPTPGGGLSISSPRARGGGHGDLVSALVLAVWAHREWDAEGVDTTVYRGARTARARH